ncbi:MAG: 4Fe-4S dicluster domain-containing protein, partial [Verrucomicrobia bacterium]|nr:4Fe-4S dicluster domain-containing protein [Verrucomicrobiota bacterium]
MNVLDPALLNRCIHCGICLATCPTYDLTQHERHSPRGRLNLMKSVLHGEIKPTRAFAEEMYDCLGCLACETSCPAGIEYGQLLETSRSLSEEHGSLDSPLRCLLRRIFLREVFTRPRLLRFLGRLVRVAQLLRLPDLLTASGIPLLLPASFRAALQLSPPISPLFSDRLIRPLEKPARTTRRVALLTGCVQDLIYAEINRDTADLLLAAGCEVVTPPVQPCCGSLHAHQGDLTTSRELARRLIRLFPPADFDAIISNAGGCGSHLRQFSHLLALDPEFSDSASLWDSKIRDIHEFL